MKRSEVAECLVLSEASYMTKYQAQDFAATIGAILVAVIHCGTAHCYMFRKGTTLYFATRGTDIKSLKNIIMDGRALPCWEPGVGFIHRGFLEWADLLWDEVAAYLIHDGFAADRVVFCGHSAGGAASNIMAARAALILKASGHPKPWLVTIGSPMVGTFGFAWMVGKVCNHIRVTNNNDPVTHVPIWPLFLHSAGRRIHITADGNTIENPSMFALLRDMPAGARDFAWQFLKAVIRLRSIFLAVMEGMSSHDHFVHNYRSRFNALEELDEETSV